jgi:cell division control protein 6
MRLYREVTREISLETLTHRRVTDLISELNMLGVISTRVISKGRYGRTKEISFDTSTDRIWDVVLKDPRLVEHNISRFNEEQAGKLFR